MSIKPDYATVQATLCTNLLRRGVVDQIIPREELAEWAKVLSDIACKPLLAEVDRLRTEIQIVIDDCDADYPPSHNAIKHGLRAVIYTKPE